MEHIDKKEAALKVAATHHDFLEKATHKYMELTGQISKEFRHKLDEMCNECLQNYQRVTDEGITCEDIKSIIVDCIYPTEITCDDSFRAAQEEMLGQLPGYYRHPVGNGHSNSEHEIFFGDTGFDVGAVGSPPWTRHESLLNLPEPLQSEIREYAIEAETDKYRLRRLRQEAAGLRELLAKAREAYNSPDNSHNRNVRVVQVLGLSTGKRPSADHYAAYERYVKLVRNEGRKREDALKTVQREFDYNSVDAARKKLFEMLREVKEWWKTSGKIKPDNLEKYWKGLVPSKR